MLFIYPVLYVDSSETNPAYLSTKRSYRRHELTQSNVHAKDELLLRLRVRDDVLDVEVNSAGVHHENGNHATRNKVDNNKIST